MTALVAVIGALSAVATVVLGVVGYRLTGQIAEAESGGWQWSARHQALVAVP